MSKVRFKTWYLPEEGDVLYAREKVYKDFTLCIEQKRGTGHWDCVLKRGDTTIKEYEAKTSKEAAWIARKEIEKLESKERE